MWFSERRKWFQFCVTFVKEMTHTTGLFSCFVTFLKIYWMPPETTELERFWEVHTLRVALRITPHSLVHSNTVVHYTIAKRWFWTVLPNHLKNLSSNNTSFNPPQMPIHIHMFHLYTALSQYRIYCTVLIVLLMCKQLHI